MGSWSDCRDCRVSYEDMAYDKCPVCAAESVDIKSLADNDELLEIGRKAIEDVLVEWRDNGLSIMNRNNGLVIRSKSGRNSHLIRMGPEMALRVGLKAIAEHMDRSDD